MNLRWIPGKFFWDSPDPKSRNWYWDNNETHRNFRWFRPENPKKIPKFWTGSRMIMNDLDMAMDQYLYIPFLVGWTSILNQLFWCELQGYQGFDPLHCQNPWKSPELGTSTKGDSRPHRGRAAMQARMRCALAGRRRGLENQGILMDLSCVKPTKICIEWDLYLCHSMS